MLRRQLNKNLKGILWTLKTLIGSQMEKRPARKTFEIMIYISYRKIWCRNPQNRLKRTRSFFFRKYFSLIFIGKVLFQNIFPLIFNEQRMHSQYNLGHRLDQFSNDRIGRINLQRLFFFLQINKYQLNQCFRMFKPVSFLIVIMILLPLAVCQGCASASQADCGVTGSTCQYFTWNNGSCVAPTFCPNSTIITVWSNASYNCVPCQGASSTVCSTCLQYNFYFNSANNLCTTCANTYGSLCLTCNSSQCVTCAVGYTLSSDLQSCFNGQCSIAYCQTCNSSTSCSACDSIHYLYNGYCVCSIPNCKECSSGTCLTCNSGYQTDSTKTKCNLICISNCDVCSDSTSCTTCSIGYVYSSSIKQCVINCALIDANCISCISTTICSACSSNYSLSLSASSCTLKCNVDNCLTCSPSTNCTQCSSGYKLVLNNGSTTTYKCSSDICDITYCTSCASVTTCATCTDLFTLSTDKTSCEPNCNISNCAFCATISTCKTCKTGFKVANGLCTAICSISNCKLCASATKCSTCNDGFILASSNEACNYNCGIVGCNSCNSTTTCSSCTTGTTLSQSATVCAVVCVNGFYRNTTQNLCIACPTSNCLTCDSIGRCLTCLNQYYLNSTDFKCYACSTIANCFNCKSGSAVCTDCLSGFTLVSGSCTNLTCSVTNCDSCVTNSSTICSTCSEGYALSNSSQACQKIVCSGGQYLVKSTCTCGPKLIFLNSQCVACSSDLNCLTCSNGICTSCTNRYYPSESVCIACPLNCKTCDASGCTQCEGDYLLSKGACTVPTSTKTTSISRTGDTINCDPGCKTCDITDDTPAVAICRAAADGYVLVAGVIYKCDSTCATCSNTPDSNGEYTYCLTCPDSYTYAAGSCLNCNDSNAISCRTTNVTISIECKPGYNLEDGVCKPCSDFCLKCGVRKSGSCDIGGCMNGYFQSKNFYPCVKCFSGCLNCDSDPNVCINCGDYKYLQNNQCFSCGTNCIKCSNSTTCQTCMTGYGVAVDGSCRSLVVNDCVAYDSNFSCTKCDFNYVLSNNTCTLNLSCNATKTCTSCRAGYYLSSKTCLVCPIIANCNYCDQTNSKKCISCTTGYYLNSRGSCIACPQTGCSACTSQTYCTAAKDGYYLVTDITNGVSGNAEACKGNCATCVYSALTCLTCKTGSTLIGTTCISNDNFEISILCTLNALNGDNTTTSAYELGLAYSIISRFYSELSTKFSFSTLADLLANSNLISIKKGSIEINLNLNSGSTTVDPNTVLTTDTVFTDVTLVSHSIVTNNSSSSSTVNLGLVLGVAIPLGILLIFIIIILKRRSDDIEDETALDGTEKQIEYQAQQF